MASAESEPVVIALPPSAALPPPAPRARRAMAVLWPAFLLACLVQLLVFALVDPGELHWRGGTLAWSRQGVYALAFFAFWLLAALACALTCLLLLGEAELNTAASPPD